MAKFKELVQSRKFWGLIVGLVVVIVQVFAPAFDFDQEAFIGLVIILVGFILGAGLEPYPPEVNKWAAMLQSRKFWGAVIGMLVMIVQGLGHQLPFDLTPDQLIAIAVTLSAYIIGVGIEGRVTQSFGNLIVSTEEIKDSKKPLGKG